MVRLSGLTLKDLDHPNGDIEIAYTGLRPGEKLFEELLIDATSKPTAHPLIYRAQERFLEFDYLSQRLDTLESAINRQDCKTALDIIASLIPEWKPGKALKLPI